LSIKLKLAAFADGSRRNRTAFLDSDPAPPYADLEQMT
jgi:hypothetical protein